MKQFLFLQGRLGRLDYAMRLTLGVAPLLVYFLPAWSAWQHVLLLGAAVATSTALTALLAVRRLHDVYLSGWYALVLLVPIVNVLGHALLLVLPGTPGLNPWGPAPGARPEPVRRATEQRAAE